MSVETAIQGQLDRIAKLRQSLQAIPATGTDFWTRVDAAADETYENRVKGQSITDMDTALLAASFFSVSELQQWFILHKSYFLNDLGLATPTFPSYLATKGWRVPFEAAEAFVEALGSASRLPAQWVFPKGTRVADTADPTSAGMHEFMRLTGTAGASTELIVDGALSAYVKGSPILAVNTTATMDTTDLVLKCTKQSGTTVNVAYNHDQAVIHTQGLVGAGAIGVGGAAAAQKDVLVKTAVAQFAAAEWVMLAKADYSVIEIAQIDSIDTLTLTMESNLINSWLEDDLVLPMFTNVVWQAGTCSDGDVLRLYAFPDRIIAL